jgi:hypothetical protein
MRMGGRRTRVATIAAAALLAQALPAAAQSGSSYDAQTCRYVRGSLVCRGANWSRSAPGTHAYDRWSNGSPATGSGTSPYGGYQFPQYLGGHNSWYGLGR